MVASHAARDGRLAEYPGSRRHRGAARHGRRREAGRPDRFGHHRSRLHPFGAHTWWRLLGRSRHRHGQHHRRPRARREERRRDHGDRASGQDPLGTGDAGRQRPAAVQHDDRRRVAERHCPRNQVRGQAPRGRHRPATRPGDHPGSGWLGREPRRAGRGGVRQRPARGAGAGSDAVNGGAVGDAVNYPAAYPGVISVGAFNEKFIKASYSSHRSYVTLTAAGDGVTAANGPERYAEVHSTSAASAVVAGIAALIKAQFPRLSSARVRQVLATSTVYRPKGGKNDGSGYGTVDAAAALMAASTMVEAVPTAATGASGAAQAPPSAPAVHSTIIRKNLGHNLITDAAIAVVVFVVLLGAILGFRSWRRRQARSARLAEVRAATQVPARKTGKPGAKGKPRVGGPGSVIAGNAMGDGGNVMGNAAWTPAGGPAAGAGMPGAGLPGAGVPGAGFTGAGTPGTGFTGAGTPGTGFTGAGTPGTGFTGAGTPGPRMSGGVSPGAADGQTAALPGRVTPQIEPVGFVPAPLAPGSEPPAFGASGPGSPDLASESSAGAPEDPGADVPAPANAPPWAPMQTDPSARFRSASGAAIPSSAFPGPADGPEAAPPGDPGGAGAGRAGGRRAQGTHRGPLRTPQVSGSPPWGPAPQPDSELPWTQTPTPARADAGLPQR